MSLGRRLGRLLVDIAVPLLAIGAGVAAYRLGAVPLLERLLPTQELLVTVLRRTGVMAVLFLAYWAVARYYERRRLTELKFKPLATAVGAAFGAVLIGVTIVSLHLTGHYQLVSSRGISVALPVIALIVLTVIFEEAIFRGVIFRLMQQHLGTVIAVAVLAPAFGALHLFNDGSTAMTMLSVTLLGAFWSLMYVYSGNLWVVAANHAAWNLTIFLSGAPLSGQELWRHAAPLESTSRGPLWMTGGPFGPEDSILNIVVLTCAVAALATLVWRRKSFAGGMWARRASRVEPSPS